jgi:peptidoglycan/LPS O-acetylase OafA/YrhL
MTAFDKTSLSMYQRNTFTFMLFPAVMFIMLFVAEKLSVQSKAISHIGGISYEIYIWHFPAIILLDLIRRMNGLDVSNPLFVTGFVAVVVAFAAVLYFAVELPLTKHLKKAYENQ